MIILLGKTASGKTTIANVLVKKYGYKQIITYTTRPIRDGEAQGKTYHYISDEEFKKKIEEGFFAEYKKYDTVLGTWYYGTSLEDLQNADDKTVVILTPQGFKDIASKVDSVKSVYLSTSDEIIMERLILRGDNEKEIERRMEKDNEDFVGICGIVDFSLQNNGRYSVEYMAKLIKDWSEN